MRKFLIFLLLFMVIFSPSIRGCFCSEISQTFISNNFLPPSPSPNDGIAVVVTLDGTMHLVEQVSWKVLWSFSSGRPIYSSYQAFHDGDKDEFNASDPNSDLYVDCGDDLQLYVHSRRHGRMRKLGLSAEEYVRRTPYVAEDGAITLGVKKTTVYLVDAKSGRLVQTYRLEDPPTEIDVQNNAGKTVFWPKNAEALVESGPSNSTMVQQLVYIMRTDYVLQYYSPKSGEVLWNVAFANIDAELRCLGSENKLSVDYSYDSELQLPCKMKPVVFQIRDHKSLESPPDNGWLRRIIPPPDSNPKHQLPPADDIVQSLPNIGWLDGLIPIPDPNQNSQLPPDDNISLPALPSDKQLLALPSSEKENPLMLDDSNMNVTTMFAEIDRSSIQSLIAFFATVSTIIGLAFYCSKQGKGSKQDQEFRLQAASHKKKKPKRSANTKNSANYEKKKKLFSEENMVGNTNEIPYVEGDEGKSFLTFTNLVDGHANGRRIGKLLVSNNEIAKGSNGTIVLEGIYDGRPVAVKRLVRSHHDVALQEIQMLIASDQHPNIVRWYGVEFDQDFVYLSLERCTCSLNDLIYVYSESFQNQTIFTEEDSNFANEYNVRLHTLMENINDIELWKPNGCPTPHLLKLMRDIVSGLAHLHELGIIHRDLKPQNVLIIKERSLCAKLSDMGISKRLTGDMSSLTRSATGYGSSGWQAPEQLRQERQTRAVDLFSLGCVLFFCITGGKHPYGDSIERDVNIVNDRKDLFLIESIPEAMDLFSFLLDPNLEMRPKAQDVLHHPLFWSPEMRLSFLRDASDRVELEDRKGESDVLNALESIAAVALDGKWDEKLETALIGDIGRYRRYKFDSVRDLLRVIRNKMNHYRELPGEIQELLGPVPEGFDDYFSKRFPKLLIEVYKVLYNYCKEEEFFQKYIKSSLI